jgi:hypothetical protein
MSNAFITARQLLRSVRARHRELIGGAIACVTFSLAALFTYLAEHHQWILYQSENLSSASAVFFVCACASAGLIAVRLWAQPSSRLVCSGMKGATHQMADNDATGLTAGTYDTVENMAGPEHAGNNEMQFGDDRLSPSPAVASGPALLTATCKPCNSKVCREEPHRSGRLEDGHTCPSEWTRRAGRR